MSNTIKTMDLSELCGKLQREDRRYTRIVGVFKYFIWIMLALLITATTYDIIRDGWLVESVANILLTTAYMCLAYIFTVYHKEFKSIDYAEPTYQMLQKAANRYRLYHNRMWLILLALIFLDLSTSFRFMDIEMWNQFQWSAFWKVHLIVTPIWLGAMCIGILKWYFRQKPLRDNALRLLKEMDME